MDPVDLICLLLFLYWIVLLARIIVSWIPVHSSGPFARVVEVLYALTEPVLRPMRNLLPPLRAGAMAIDLSPLIVFIVLGILRGAICG